MKIKSLGAPILKLVVRGEEDIVSARHKTRLIAQHLGFDRQDQVRLATATSELVRNAYQYAHGGTVDFFFAEPETFLIKVSDKGPGIANLDEILNGVYISKTGMGIGLLGSKKLMDVFEIESGVGKGTEILAGKRIDRRGKLIRIDYNKLAAELVSSGPKGPIEELQNQNRELLETLDELRASKVELSELNNELAETNRGVVALYSELDEKAASLQRANEVKTSFLSNMTHEFRTPLSSVISLTRMLLSRMDGDLSAEQDKQVRYIAKSAEGLLELVNDLLDLAKVEAGKVAINAGEFDIDELISGLRGVFRPLMQQHPNIDLTIAEAPAFPKLKTDQAKISQVLRNLLSNAMKFTEKGSVTMTSTLARDGFIHFTITDTGVGVSPEHLEHIFEDFSQVESRLQKKQKGTGLGLPLSRKLARLLGGDLWVESTPGVGSSFHFLVPSSYSGAGEAVLISSKDEAKPGAPHLEDAVNLASANFRVLLIDDDEPSRYVLKTLVKNEISADFFEEDNADSGINSIRKLKPDLVFLDLTMPDRTGFQALEEIKGDDNLTGIPIVVNTAKKLTSDERMLLEREATAILSKDRSDEGRAVEELRFALRKAGFDYRVKQHGH